MEPDLGAEVVVGLGSALVATSVAVATLALSLSSSLQPGGAESLNLESDRTIQLLDARIWGLFLRSSIGVATDFFA